MTDITPVFDSTSAWAAIAAEEAERARLADEAMPANKAALFATLATAGITSVVVTFDGCGDSSQIENVDAPIGDELTDLPDTIVEIATPARDGSGLQRRTLPLARAVEEIAYDLLGDQHAGWEINDGAFGAFAFDVSQRSIMLDFNSRYVAIESSSYEW